MNISSYDQFLEDYNSCSLVPVCAEILGDLETPVSTFLKTTDGTHRFLLESVERGENRGRYSIIGDRPLLILKSKNGRIHYRDFEKGMDRRFDGDPFQELKKVLANYRPPQKNPLPFMQGALFGFLGYDCVRHIEKLPEHAMDDLDLPDIHLFLPGQLVVFDNLLHLLRFIVYVRPDGRPREQYDRALTALEQRVKASRGPSSEKAIECREQKADPESSITHDDFLSGVEKIKSHISRGDIFQGVLSQRLQSNVAVPAFDVYRALRMINPSPYMFYLDMGGVQVLGSSPETLIKRQGERVTVNPIAGTRKRGRDEKEDEANIAELLNDPKERAEHIMLVDLGRNDVGRVAEYGSVEVAEFMAIEKYSHVIHIVSTVSGTVRPGIDAVDVFRAGFPAGTVTGAPKVRAMQILEELEPTRRGPYAGAAGYFSFDGDMDVCIAIRTIVVKNGTAYWQAGAGIVADSIPENEYLETLNKARALQRALEYAQGGLR